MSIAELRSICTNILKDGRQKFGLATGIVSHIYDDTYEVFAADSETGIPQTGDIFDVRAVYCRAVLDTKQSVVITEIGDTQGMCLHPLYDVIPCEAYISSPLIVDGVVWGTLNYTSFEIRGTPFSHDEIAYNEAQAKKIAAAITKTDF